MARRLGTADRGSSWRWAVARQRRRDHPTPTPAAVRRPVQARNAIDDFVLTRPPPFRHNPAVSHRRSSAGGRTFACALALGVSIVAGCTSTTVQSTAAPALFAKPPPVPTRTNALEPTAAAIDLPVQPGGPTAEGQGRPGDRRRHDRRVDRRHEPQGSLHRDRRARVRGQQRQRGLARGSLHGCATRPSSLGRWCSSNETSPTGPVRKTAPLRLAAANGPTWTFVNLELVRRGLASAVSYPPDVGYFDALATTEQEARSLAVGLWGPEPAPAAAPTPKPTPKKTPRPTPRPTPKPERKPREPPSRPTRARVSSPVRATTTAQRLRQRAVLRGGSHLSGRPDDFDLDRHGDGDRLRGRLGPDPSRRLLCFGPRSISPATPRSARRAAGPSAGRRSSGPGGRPTRTRA